MNKLIKEIKSMLTIKDDVVKRLSISIVVPVQSDRGINALLLPNCVYLDACGGIAFVSQGCPGVQNREY